MKIEINDFGQVRCQPDGSTVLYCDPLHMFRESAACGNCPILEMCEKYEAYKYGDLGDGFVDLTKKIE